MQPIAGKADRARKLVGKGAPVSTVGRDMNRFYDIAGWLCSSLGIALLVTSLILVPENRALGDDPPQCPTNPPPTLGCVSAGSRCKFFNKDGLCGVSRHNFCTCKDPTQPDQ